MIDNEVPDFEWAFAYSTLLGSLVSGTRKFTYNGKPLIGGSGNSLGAGLRWCSAQWQAQGLGERGRVARIDNMSSHMSVVLTGKIKHAKVYLVDDDALGEAAYLLGSSMAAGPAATDGLYEWSFALARQPGRTHRGVWMKGPGADNLAEKLHCEVGVNWMVHFWPVSSVAGKPDESDRCEVYDGTGAWRASLPGGEVRHEEEAVPLEFISLGFEFGTSLDVREYGGGGVKYPAPGHRPLERDELESGWPCLGAGGVVFGEEEVNVSEHEAADEVS